MNDPSLSDVVEVTRLGFTFASRQYPSLIDISFALKQGSWTLISGRSGSGKSTLLRALVGLIPNQSAGTMQGSVRLFGLDTRGATPSQLARRAGLVLQSPDDQICTATVESEVAFGLENLSLPPDEIDARITQWLARFGLSECRQRATQTLSGGQKQRLMLASILAMGPRLLVLDEPLAQLDAEGAAELIEVLAQLRDTGLAIVVAEHRFDDLLGVVDRVLVLEHGELLDQREPDDARRPLSQADEPFARSFVSRAPEVGRKGAAFSGPKVAIPCQGASVEQASVQAPAVILNVDRLEYRYSSQSRPVWSDLSFQIRTGERVAIVGPNGSGKTTLLNALAAIVRPSKGTFSFAKADLGTTPLGLVPQNPDLALFCRTVEDELAFGPRQLRLPAAEIKLRVDQAARAFALEDLLSEAPLALSQGERLRVAVAAAVTPRPRLLLLDEPTIGQDAEQMLRLLSMLDAMVADRHLGAVLFTSHDLRAIRAFATRVLVIAQQRLLADSSGDALLASADALRRAGLRWTKLHELPAQLDASKTNHAAGPITARPR